MSGWGSFPTGNVFSPSGIGFPKMLKAGVFSAPGVTGTIGKKRTGCIRCVRPFLALAFSFCSGVGYRWSTWRWPRGNPNLGVVVGRADHCPPVGILTRVLAPDGPDAGRRPFPPVQPSFLSPGLRLALHRVGAVRLDRHAAPVATRCRLVLTTGPFVRGDGTVWPVCVAGTRLECLLVAARFTGGVKVMTSVLVLIRLGGPKRSVS